MVSYLTLWYPSVTNGQTDGQKDEIAIATAAYKCALEFVPEMDLHSVE